MTQPSIAEIHRALLMPFEPQQVHWRVGSTNAKYRKSGEPMKGDVLAYLDARDVMWRLDEAVGADNWQCRYPFSGCCEVGIRFNDEWIWKANAGSESNIEREKGLASDAFKRAAVLHGVGRCYYDLPNNKYTLDEYNGKAYLPKELKRELTNKLNTWNKAWIEKHLGN